MVKRGKKHECTSKLEVFFFNLVKIKVSLKDSMATYVCRA